MNNGFEAIEPVFQSPRILLLHILHACGKITSNIEYLKLFHHVAIAFC